MEQVHGEMKRCRHLCWKIGQTDPDEREEIVRLEEELLGPLKGGTFLTPPFQVDLGCRLFLGENVFANHGLTVMSVGTITIDDGVMMGPEVGLFTVNTVNEIDMEFITLSNGIKMPILGYGVFQVPPQEAERCVADALSVGYRLIDTAQAYFNEEGVGDAIAKSGIPREEVFLVTKVWISNNGEQKAAASIDESLRKLKTDYIDLLLIHQAYGDVFGTWRAMEKAYRDGKVRAIGVSNFQAGRFFDLAHYVDVKPMVNQLQCNVMVQQTGIEPILAEFGTKMMAWGPLGGQGVDGIVKNEKLAAIGAKYGKSAAQVALRWLTQRGIVAIPKSSHKERMEQNLNVLDFTLSSEEMELIAGLNEHDSGLVSFGDPQFVKYLIENYG